MRLEARLNLCFFFFVEQRRRGETVNYPAISTRDRGSHRRDGIMGRHACHQREYGEYADGTVDVLFDRIAVSPLPSVGNNCTDLGL